MAQRFRTVRGRAPQQNTYQKGYLDLSLICAVVFLLVFGLIMIYSSSYYKANLTFGDNGYFLKKQLQALGFGVAALIVFTYVPYHFWEKFAMPAYFGSIFLIILVLSPLGYEANGARRWLNLGISVQPAEIAKLGIILFLAVVICKKGRTLSTWKGLGIIMIFPTFVAVLVWKITENMSSAIIIMGIAVLMLFIASPGYKKFIISALIVCGIGGLLLWYILSAGSAGASDFRSQRILAWRDPEAYASGKGFQTLQALYAIGSGGLFGKGLGESMQKLGFLPEAQNDMIFSIICEELGLFGASALILLFVILIWRCLFIANNAPDLFGGLLVVGVIGHLAIQIILNIAVCTNLIPNTGISLPFISYGGSSVVFLLAEIGLVLNVGRNIRLKDE